LLTAGEIAAQMGLGEIGWSGTLRGDSLLLCLGSPIQPLVAFSPGQVVDLTDQDSIDALYGPPEHDWQSFDLPPGHVALCQAHCPVRLGSGLAGAISTLSHLARVGLATHVASPWVLPGWDGYLTFELSNAGPVTLQLKHGMPVARLVIFRMEGVTRPMARHPFYGSSGQLGSRYADEFTSNRTRGT
jgi:deoxycytidine triphosphate deaminase